jgi:hypothetical protein
MTGVAANSAIQTGAISAARNGLARTSASLQCFAFL